MIFSSNSWAQKTIASKEKALTITTSETVFVHSNATTFVSGETLFYQLYCLNPENNMPSAISKIGYIELLDNKKASVFKHKLFLEDGIGQGDFFVPTSLKTGNYKLIAHTTWMLNKTEATFFEMDIFIINPFQVNEEKQSETKNQEIASNNPINNSDSTSKENFELVLNKQSFSSRDLVQLTIKSLNDSLQGGNYSMSVRKLEELPFNKPLSAMDFIKKSSKSNNGITKKENNLVLPELRGEIISGKIVSKNENNSVENKTVALSVSGKFFAFKTAKTTAFGNFIFSLDKPYHNSDVTVQVMGISREDFTVVLDQPKSIDTDLIFSKPILVLNKELKASLEERSVASQIENAYFTKKKDSIAAIQNQTLFYSPLTKDYILDDFTRFPTLKETITEVVLEMYYTKSKNKYTIGVRDNDPLRELSEQALVLVDGLLIQDSNELFEYNMENIHKISIIRGGYYYGSNVFGGIINFSTKNNDFVSKANGDYILRPEMNRPLKNKVYYKPDYTNKAKYARIPDYRYQIAWIPKLTLDKNENVISFYTSDVSGTFEIILEGFTSQGIPVSLKKNINVK
jgi:hypothetical protein